MIYISHPKQKILPTITLMIIGIVVAIGISYVSAAWTNPVAGAPAGNLEVPVNATSNGQVKQGSLSVNTFAALGDGWLQQEAYIGGPLKGIEPGSTDPTLRIGGNGTAGPQRVVTTVTGTITSQKTLGSTELINTNLNPLCSDDKGHVVFCGAVVPPPPPNAYAITLNGQCSGIDSSSTLTGISGDTVVLNMSFSGYLAYTGVNPNRSASMNFTTNGVTGNAATQTWIYPQDGSSNGFSLSKDITFVMPANSTTINTSAVTNNSSQSMTNASLTVVSVNGVANGASNAVCVGNSQGG